MRIFIGSLQKVICKVATAALTSLVFWVPAVQAQPASCSVPGKDGPVYLAPTYFPASPSVGAGATQLSIGAADTSGGAGAGTTAVTAGDLILIIQMQDAAYNNGNSVAFGDGSTGRGYTNLNSAGKYEFRRVVSVAGGVVTLDQGLTNSYTRSNPTGGTGANETGNRRFQVIRVPQLSSVTLPGGTISPPAWNGETGGVWVTDVAGTLNMNGTTINATGRGFRGGGGIQNEVINGLTDYRNTNPVDVTSKPMTQACGAAGTDNVNVGAFKGEGISGTPRFVRADAASGNSLFYTFGAADLGSSGYAAGADLARGAPGNAGGGGTQHNAGGGGGSNAGQGGIGGEIGRAHV